MCCLRKYSLDYSVFYKKLLFGFCEKEMMLTKK
jgi:hypothetical protein